MVRRSHSFRVKILSMNTPSNEPEETMEADTRYDLEAIPPKQRAGLGSPVTVFLAVLILITGFSGWQVVHMRTDVKTTLERMQGLQSQLRDQESESRILNQSVRKLELKLEQQQEMLRKLTMQTAAMAQMRQEENRRREMREREMAEREEMREEKNAAPFYLRAFEHLADADAAAELVKSFRRGDDEWVERAAGVIEKNQVAIEWVKQALERKGCQFPWDRQKGFDAQLPFLGNMRQLARLGVLYGNLQEARSIPNEALDLYAAVTRMGQDAARGGPLLSLLVGIACAKQGLQAINNLLMETALEAEVLHGILEKLDEIQRSPLSLAKAIHVEREVGMQTFAHLLEGDGDPKALGLQGEGMTREQLVKSMERYGEFMDLLVEASTMSYALARKKIAPILGKVKDDRLAIMLIPTVDNLFLAFAVMQARLAAVRIHAALRVYKNDIGKFPESLLEIAEKYEAEIPGDPFSGEPFKYFLSPDGPVIYCVGPDGDDDKAEIEIDPDKNQPGRNGDLVFRIRVPKD